MRSVPGGVLVRTIWGENLGDAFGGDVVALSDTSGNGIADYLVLAGSYDILGAVNVGAVYLLEGADGSVRHKFVGAWANQLGFLTVLGAMGDIDGDGLGDFAIVRRPPGVPGRVTIYSGLSVTQIIREHVATVGQEGFCNEALFSVGDQNGDGSPEYVIGNASYLGGSLGSPTQGRAWLYDGASGAVLGDYSHPGTMGLGLAGAALEDLDGDGWREVLLSAPWTDGVAGAVYVFSGKTRGFLQKIPGPSGPAPFPGSYMFGNWLVGVNDGQVGFLAADQGGPLHIFDRGFVSVAPNPANPIPNGVYVTFTLTAPEKASGPFHLFFSTSASQGIPVGSRKFPLDPVPLLFYSAAWPFLTQPIGPTGTATVQLLVPPDPALLGTALWYAGITFDGAAPYGIRSMSTARRLVIE